MEEQGQAASKEAPSFVFAASSSAEDRIRYLRATTGRERRVMALVGSVVMTALILLVGYTVVFPSEKIPGMVQAWREIRFYAIVPIIVILLSMFLRSILLFVLDSGWAWDSARFGKKFIENGERYGPLSKEHYAYRKNHEPCKYAFYFDERMGWRGRVPVDAELYGDRLVVKGDGGAGDTAYRLGDAYKEFWGAGVVVLRFNTSRAPTDVVLGIEGWGAGEVKRLRGFLDGALPPWCRRYARRPQSPLSRRRRAFMRHPVYDRWEHRVPLVHRGAEVAFFMTPSERYMD